MSGEVLVECEGCRDANLRAKAFRDAWIALRTDAPNAGLFNRWEDALAEASHRAALVGRRYVVRFEPNNHWWEIVERGPLAWWHGLRSEAGL